MTSIQTKLNIVTANPTLGKSFNYLWVGVDSIQNKALAF